MKLMGVKRFSVLLVAAMLLSALLGIQLPSARAAVVPNTAKDGKLRVLLTSDIHYCTSAYYGVAGKDRLQLWVDSVNLEHEKAPLDLIIVAGDMSLDHFYSNGNIAGSYMGTNKVSYTEKFIKEYVSQLPAEVPVRFIAGNHEQYNNTQWKSYTGNDRQCSVRVEGNLFVLLDNYNSFLEPNATENSVYTPSDVDFIQSEMAKYPDDKVWLVAHYFDAARETEEFKRLVRENDRIMGLFGGHDHMGDVKTNTANTNAWGSKPYTMCGTYALSGTVTPEHSAGQPQRFGYEAKELTAAQQDSLDQTLANFWGFRELVITPTSASSNYISVATGSTAPYFYGRKISLSRTTKYGADYGVSSVTADWGPAADGIYYIGSSGDMKAFSALGQTFDFTGKTVKLTRDIDMIGVDFTMIPRFAGTLDGCGYAVKNLSMYATSGTLAMIDQLYGATIQNLRMVDGTVKLVDSHSAAGIAVRAKGTCLFRNVYCKMNISVDSDCYRAGGFLAFPEIGDITFDSCVSECTISGMRGGGFVAQVNYNNGSLTLRDCAFVGDLSGAGKWSGGIVGLCAGNVTMERCVSLGKQSTHAESGGLLFIDHQNQSETTTTAVSLKDCYAAVDTQVPVGTQANRSFRLKFTMEYTGKTPLTINTSSTNLLASHQSTIQSNFGYLAKGSAVNLTTSNLKTLCPALTAWSSVGGTVTYGTSKTVPEILPTTVWNLMNGKSITATPSSVCSLCGGNAKAPENLGNGTHVIACDRMTHSIDSHSYANGKCACGQWETPYVLLDFLPLSEANETSNWTATDRDTGVVSFTVNHDSKGTMEATAKYRDAYVSMANTLDKEYLIKQGDVIEVRLKGSIETGSCPRTTVYFITDQQTSYAETHQLTHAMVFNGNYETVTLGTLDAYVGQSIQKLRIDVFQNASTDFAGTYSLDYIYVGPAEYAPSKGSSALYFDFNNDEYSAQRYGTTTYRGYNYDVSDSWRRGETGEHPVVANGKLSFAITERYNASNEPVHITAIEPVGTNKTFSWGNDCKYANDLSYDPSKAEVLQIRLRLTDVQHYYPNNTKQYLRLFYLPEGATEWSCGTAPNDWSESILIAIDDQYMDGGAKEGEFFTLTMSLKGKKFSTYESIRGIMLNFMGMRGGRVEIDYLYIGPATAENLLFDFDGTGEERYDNISYGMMDYDTTAHWFHEADVTELTIGGGELHVTTASSVKNDNTQYVETSKTDMRKVDPLHYTPKAGDIVQFKYRIESYNADLNSGKTASITVYGWDGGDNATYQGTPWVAVDTGKAGTDVTVTKDVPANWLNYDVTRIRMTFRGLIGSKIVVDHLYVGSGCNAPTPVHTYTYKATKNPTTSAAGILTGTCIGCSATTTVTLPKLNTTDYTKSTIKMPTCTETGTDKYTWKTITYGSFSFNVTTNAKGHTEVVDKAVAPTCTATGKTEGKHCSVCNAVITAQQTVYAKGHTEVIDKAVAATCTATGMTEGKHCSVCSAVLTAQETVAALGHDYNSVVTAPTCTAEGYTTHTCSRCSNSYVDSKVSATGHNYTYKATKNPTTSATGTLTGTCSKCNGTTTVTLPKLTTTDYTKTTTKAPTCTATGTDKYTWKTTTYGSFYFNVTTKAKGHTSVADKAVDPTCTATGLTAGAHCSVCSAVLTAQEVVPAKGHTEVIDNAVAPTCTATGLTEGKHCSVCNVVITAQEVVPAKGHTEVIDTAVAPTCTETGLTEGKHCSACGVVITAQEVVPAIGHAPVYTIKDDETHIITCENCDFTEEAPHSYEDGICICDRVEIKEPVEESTWKLGHSLNLASDISINYAIAKSTLAGYDMDTVYILAEIDTYKDNDKTGTKEVKILPVLNGNYYYFVLEGITAVNMNDEIRAVLYATKDGQVHYSPVDTYSVATYAYAQLGKATAQQKLKVLCAELLRYGSKAQTYKGYRTDSLVDAKMTEEQKALLSDMDAVTFGSTNITGTAPTANAVQWLGKSLDLASKVSVKFIFSLGSYTGSTEELNLKVTYTDVYGKEKELIIPEVEIYNASRGYYAFTLDSLLAAELRSVLTVQIRSGDTVVSGTLQYAADTYGNNKTGTLGDLCKALFVYSDSAKAYFTN